MSLDTQLTLALLQELLIALRASDDDGLAAGSELLSFCELGQQS